MVNEGEPVLNYLKDGSKRGFVREDLIIVFYYFKKFHSVGIFGRKLLHFHFNPFNFLKFESPDMLKQKFIAKVFKIKPVHFYKRKKCFFFFNFKK